VNVDISIWRFSKWAPISLPSGHPAEQEADGTGTALAGRTSFGEEALAFSGRKDLVLVTGAL
jgi:hypothetical protein